jgi:peptidoglycan/xylan/chitin deacetylase (PgdA/CDA1 family)
MKRLLLALLFGLPVLAPAREIAITIDDLPVHSALPPGETRLSVAERMIAALKDAKVPAPYGFVNAGPIAENPALQEVLTAWRSAGFPLGNHTWSHANLDKLSATDFEAEITRNEAALRDSPDWHWFRYPFLIEGSDPAKRAEIRRFLKERHYRIAAVTMNFSDYRWNDPYARCMAAHDETGVAELERLYLGAARQAADDARRLSPNIAYVLLMHVGAFDARVMPKLLAQYREQGYRFITLPEAERHYDDAVTPPLSVPPVEDSTLAGICAAHP